MAVNIYAGSDQLDKTEISPTRTKKNSIRSKFLRLPKALVSSVTATAVVAGLVMAAPISPASASTQWAGGEVVLDTAFNKRFGDNLNVQGNFKTMVWDGSGYVVGGWFGAAPDFPIKIFRVKADGSLDADFNAQTEVWQPNEMVTSIVWDGSGFLIGGQFTNGPGSGAGRKSVFRIRQDGSLDNAFNDTLSQALADATNDEGLNRPVMSAAFDGSGYLIGGYYTNGPGSGAGRKEVFRIEQDGSLDESFNDALTNELAIQTENEGINGIIQSIVYDGSGYVVSGSFANGPGSAISAKRIFRVKGDGTLDNSFNNILSRDLSLAGGLNGGVYSVAWDGSGYVVGGGFTNAPGSGSGDKRVFRVKANGLVDDSFNDKLSRQIAKFDDDGLDAMAYTVLFDGSGFIITGLFTNAPGVGAGTKRIFRTKLDGSLDSEFNNSLSQALASATGGVGLGNYVLSAAYDPTGIAFAGMFKNGPDDTRLFRIESAPPKPPVPPKPVIKKPLTPQGFKVQGKSTASKFKVSWKAPASNAQRPVVSYQLKATVSGSKKSVMKNRKASQRSYTLSRNSLIRLVPKKKRKAGKNLTVTVKVYAKNSAGAGSPVSKRFKIKI